MNLVITVENKTTGAHLYTRTVKPKEIMARSNHVPGLYMLAAEALKQATVEGTLAAPDFENASWLADIFRPKGYKDVILYYKTKNNIALSYDGPETDMPDCDNLRIDILVDDVA